MTFPGRTGEIAGVKERERGGISFFLLLVFLLFVYFEPSLFIPAVAQFRVAMIVAAVAFSFAFFEKRRIPKATQNALLILLIVAAFISLVFSISFDRSVPYFSMLIKVVTLYFLILMTVNTMERVRKFMIVIFVYTALTTIFTIVLSKFGIYKPGIADPYRLSAVFGGIGDGPNQLGALMVAMIPLAVLLAMNERNFPKKAILAIVALSFLLLMIQTRSRGAFVGWIVVFLQLLWYYRRKKGLVLLLAVLSIFMFLRSHSGYLDRIGVLKSEETIVEDGPAADRIMQIKSALKLMALRPLTGVGMNNFIPAKIEILGHDPYTKVTRHVAHNAYLGLGAEIGVIGFLAFSLLLAVSIRDCVNNEKSLKDKNDSHPYHLLATGIRMGLIGFAVTIFFLSEEYNSVLYQFYATIVAMKGIAQEEGAKGALEAEIKVKRKIA